MGCSVGMWNIGFVMLAYGATSTACSLLAGYAAKLLGRLSLMIGGKPKGGHSLRIHEADSQS